jgi:hypothetical protein
MGLETFNFIDSLNASNPVGSTDPKSQGDNHLRGIKSTLLSSFPGITGAVTSTHTELNYLDGVTGVTGSGKLVLDTAPTLGAITATSYDGVAAANLVDKSASETITGATWDFQAITAVSFGGITSANLVDKSANETISGATWDFQAITAVSFGGIASANLVDKSAAETISGNWDFAAITATSYDGIAAGNLLDETAAIDTTVTNSNAAQPGYKGCPLKTQNGNYELILGDAGKIIRKASGGAGETITIPANSATAFPIGTVIVIHNDGGGDLSIAITTDTLEQFVTGNTGTRTLADNGKAVLEKVASTTWKISGLGVS